MNEDKTEVETPLKETEVAAPVNEPKPKRKKLRKILKFSLVALVVIVNGAAGYSTWYLHGHPKKILTLTRAETSDSSNADSTPLKQTTSALNALTSSDVKTEHYISNSKNVEFDYPSDWRIDATSNDSTITINSAKFVYKTANGTTTGILTIQMEKQPVSSSYTNPISADNYILETPLLITYKNPTAIQRKETHLNIFGANYNTKDQRSDGAFVSGNVVFAKGNKTTDKDVSKVDPLITIEVNAECQNGDGTSSCHYYIPGDVSSSYFDSVPTFQNAKKVIESLRFNS